MDYISGRQGPGGRTHLVSPAMAAAAAVHGHFIDVREVTIGPEASHIGQSSGEPAIAVDNGHAIPKAVENNNVDDASDGVGQSAGAPAVCKWKMTCHIYVFVHMTTNVLTFL